VNGEKHNGEQHKSAEDLWAPVTVPIENPAEHDAEPRDAEGWRLHDDGTRVHRYTCTIHDGQGCDGHCGPAPANPAEHLLNEPQGRPEEPTRDIDEEIDL
jgi:hypothetical protein